MYNSIDNGASESTFGLLFGMAWVAILMLAVTVSAVQNRRERMQRMRIGIEVEALRNHRAEDASNHSIANYLATERQRLGDKAFEKYWGNHKRLKTLVMSNRQKRREEARKALPLHYIQKYFEIQPEGWSQGNTSYYTKVTTDGSLNSGGLEVVSHPLMDGQHHGWIAHVVQALRHITKIDRSCGLHIHVGLRDPDARFGDEGQITLQEAEAIAGRCAWAYAYFTPVFNQFVSSSRHNGQYCQTAHHMLQRYPSNMFVEHKRLSHHTMDATEAMANQVAELVDTDDASQGYMIYSIEITEGDDLYRAMYRHNTDHGRYYHCNTGSLVRRNFGTVEYRQHQGTVNPTKVRNWVQLMYDFTMRCASETDFKAIMSYEVTRDGFWAFLDYAKDDVVRDYYEKRAVVLRGETLIRNCKACGSNTCVHEECLGDVPSAQSLSVLDRNGDHTHTCDNCDSWVTVDSWGDAHCDYCDCEVSYSTGALASVALGLLITAPAIGAVALLVGCGIGAIHAGAKRFKHKAKLASLWRGLSSRGGQAAGMAWTDRKTGATRVFKAPESSTALARKVKHLIGRHTVSAFLHTRYATHGKNNADNAHPHHGPQKFVTMVHNGVVHNHDDVWTALGIKPTGPVDSQAVAACLEIGGIEKVVEHCQGSMSLIWTDSRDPTGTLKFWTNGGNPLAAGRLHHPNNGPVVIASTMDHLEAAMGNLEDKKSQLKSAWSCYIGREYKITPNGSITHRDIDGSEDTATVSYDWRTFSTLYPSVGKSKSKKRRVIKVPVKAPATGDSCGIRTSRPPSAHYNWDDMALNEAMNEVWYEMSINGFEPCDIYHGYNAEHHEAKRPDGTKYDIPHEDEWGAAMDPINNTEHMVEVMTARYDPRYHNEEDDLFMIDPMMMGDYGDYDADDYDWSENWHHTD